jgi:DNA gyrase subunit A
MLLGLKDMIAHFVEHRLDVIIRRTRFDLRKAEERAHILEGLLIALDHLDAVIALIRASQTPDIAREGLMSSFGLSEIQARAILDMRLQRLTGLERDKIKEEYAELMKLIDYLRSVLADEGLRMQIVKDETLEIKEKYGDKRRTQIVTWQWRYAHGGPDRRRCGGGHHQSLGLHQTHQPQRVPHPRPWWRWKPR